MVLIVSLAHGLQDVPHGKSPIVVVLFADLYLVITDTVQAELGELHQLEYRGGLPVNLRLLPLAVSCLGRERLETETSGDDHSRYGGHVLVPDMNSLYLELNIVHKGRYHGFPQLPLQFLLLQCTKCLSYLKYFKNNVLL